MTVSFGIVIVMVAAQSIFAVTQVQKVDDTNSYVIESPMTGEVALLNFRASMRNLRFTAVSASTYAPTSDDDRVRTYQADAETAYNDGITYLDEYETIIKNDANLGAEAESLVKKVGEVKNLLTQYKTEVFDPIAEAAFDSDHEKTLEILNAGAEINNALRTVNDELITAAAATADEFNKSSSAMADQTVLTLSVIAAVVVLVSLLMAMMVSSLVSKPIVRLVDVAENVAKGNLNINIDTSLKDETGMLAKSFSQVVFNVKGLINGTAAMYKQHEDDGDIDARIDEAGFEGAYREMAAQVNRMVASYVKLISDIFEVMSAFGDGNFDKDLAQQAGKKRNANVNIDNLRDRVNAVSGEIQTLVGACIEGKLSTRGETDKFSGTWKQLVKQLNELVDAVVTPINESISVMVEMSNGNLSANMTGDYKGDFLTIKNSLNTTVNDISSYITEINKNLAEMAAGDLRGGITRNYVGDFSSIKDAINAILLALSKTANEINASSEQVLAGAKQISESAMSLAEGATEQASTVQELNASIDTINEQTRTNAKNAQAANDLSLTTAANARKGNDEMKRMLDSMAHIKESSNSISSIIKTIQDIAFQTNLLALNAAVEAARAGEHGKGFAVGADEVRTLAGRSQQAAQETTELIEGSIARVNEGTDIANTTAKSLDTIVDNVDEVSKLIAGISGASNSQSEAIGQVTIGINQISEVVQNNSSTSEESAAAAQELNSQAEVLQQMVSFFKTK